MLITVLKSKISYATLNNKNLYYEGSITIDEAIMQQANLKENEQVHIVNLNNGERLITYVIKGEKNSKVFALNGPAARKGEIGDKIFILSYAQVDVNESYEPILVNL